ncbi:MAG: TetR family transcriptional regulator, partial [Actinomycetota bacterium]|nr:TetR family transcriptional regulator [Actinomycetota bacterium]
MGRPAALSRARIVDGAAALVAEHGAEALTARRLGEALGCDPTALYRHVADMGEVQREVGDHFLGAVTVDARAGESWDATVRRICVGLRSVQLRQPRLAALVRAAPTRLGNEL